MGVLKIHKHVILLSMLVGLMGNAQMIFPDNPYYKQDNYLESFKTSKSFVDVNPSNGLFTNAIPTGTADSKLVDGINNFALNINKAMLFNENKENIVLSPLSITGALALLLLGSVGQTYNELATALGFFNGISASRSVHQEFGLYIDKLMNRGQFWNSNNAKPNISYASAIFLQQDIPIREQYEDFIKNVYRGIIQHVDYRFNPQDARNVVNKWVKDVTMGKIDSILSSNPPPNTQFILANALYFKGEWEQHFIQDLTTRAPFTLDKRTGQSVKIDLMGNFGMFPYSRNNELIVVGLPYKGNNTFLWAIKPADSLRKDIKQIVNELNAEQLDIIIRNTTYQKTIVTFPKMKLSSSYNLRAPLKRMGINAVFSSSLSNLGLLSPPQNKPAPLYDPGEGNELFIFTRFGGEDMHNKSNNCSPFFENKNSSITSCTTTENIDGKNLTVVYKRFGNNIGRRILNETEQRTKRQVSFDESNPGLYVDDVVHKVEMDITETGTEAAAATGVFITRSGKPVFAGNEPFFFVIRDEETKIILFSSFVFKPTPNYPI